MHTFLAADEVVGVPAGFSDSRSVAAGLRPVRNAHALPGVATLVMGWRVGEAVRTKSTNGAKATVHRGIEQSSSLKF